MRLTLIILTTLVLLLSCNSSDTNKVSSDTTAKKLHRQLLIEELERLKTIIASKDKEKIADIFQFPLSDTTVGIYIDDSTFNAELKESSNNTTRAMFIRFFPQISESLQIDELNQLFKNLKLDNLLYQDTLGHEAYIKTEPCYHSYNIEIEKDLVKLTVGTNANRDYKSKSASEDESPENSSEMCEHVLWWVFRFDGRKLHFEKISGAG
jgi:hypothetical protein